MDDKFNPLNIIYFSFDEFKEVELSEIIKEYVKMPADLVGSVDGKSSLGRLGIVIHTTSSSVNPGWEGNLVLEISNLSRMPVAIYPGMRIAKLTFHKMTSAAEKPYGDRKDTKYNKQASVDETKVYKEFS